MAGHRRRTALIAAAALALTSCLNDVGAGGSTGVPQCTTADTVRIQTTNGTVAVGATKQLSFVTSAPLASCVRWNTSNGFIARMSSGGIIQGLAVGTVTITAEAAANVDSTRFTVVAAGGGTSGVP